MKRTAARTSHQPDAPPRGRILAAARKLFYRNGIHTVGVEAIAAAAGTNKMTLYRHFASKDALVAAYLTGLAAEGEARWDEARALHPGDPDAQLHHLLKRFAERDEGRGCPLVNAAVELAERRHPARRVIEAHKRRVRERLLALLREAGYARPQQLADELFLLVEGARVCLQALGREGPSARLHALAGQLLADAPRKPGSRR